MLKDMLESWRQRRQRRQTAARLADELCARMRPRLVRDPRTWGLVVHYEEDTDAYVVRFEGRRVDLPASEVERPGGFDRAAARAASEFLGDPWPLDELGPPGTEPEGEGPRHVAALHNEAINTDSTPA